MCTGNDSGIDDPVDGGLSALLDGGRDQEPERARLLATALRVVAQRGYADATCGEGIRHAGVSSEVAHRHFAGKLECFLAAYDAATAALLDGARRVGREHADWAGRVRAVLGYLLLRLSMAPEVARACVVELPRAGHEALARQDRALAKLASLLGPPPDRAGALSPSIVDSLLVGGVWEAIRTTIERDGASQLVTLRDELSAWVLGLGGGSPPRVVGP